MALVVKKALSRFASIVPPCKHAFLQSVEAVCKGELTVMKTTKAFSTSVNLEPSANVCLQDQIEVKKSKKRYAMLIGYQGADYYGVCMNPGQDTIPTVGKDIIKALIKAGYTDESYLLSAKSLSQASRTDSGVSALRQVIVLDLDADVDFDKLRPYLSEDIKAYGMIRTIKSFVPFRYCEGRSYLYYIPSYVFSPHSMELHKDYRLTSEKADQIQRLLKKFLGKKNYHNFTRGRSFHDPRAIRKITNVELLEPVVKDGYELACIRLKGASFILNQIRKIIAALVIAVRGYAPEELIDIALSRQGMSIARAPPYGLILEDVDFQWYNQRFRHAGIEPIDFSKYEVEVEALKHRILSGVVATEVQYERTKLWVESLQYIPFVPFSKEQLALESNLQYDDTLDILRSENTSVPGKQAAALFI